MLGRAAVRAHMGDVMAGHRAVRAVMVGLGLVDARDHRFDDFHRHFRELRLHRIGAVVPRATLDDVDFGSRDQRQSLFGLRADVLHPLMAGSVVGDLAERRS